MTPAYGPTGSVGAVSAVGGIDSSNAGVPTRGVWISDPDGALGRRVAAALRACDGPLVGGADDADVAVWLAGHDATVGDAWQGARFRPMDDLLECSPGPAHVVLVSSALVYGAWANNPVPLTEDTALRPDADLALGFVALEQTVDEWRRAEETRSATVLRPAVTVAADQPGGLASALVAGMGQRLGEDDPPSQFLHLDDLAAAIVLAVTERLDGVFNVAPHGSIPGDRVRALTGSVPRVRLPARVHDVVGGLRWRFERGPIPAGMTGYTRFPWIVANDRLVAAGWIPTVTNEQAYVEATEAPWWTMVSPERRQELALGAAATAVGSVVLGVVRAVRRSAR